MGTPVHVALILRPLMKEESLHAHRQTRASLIIVKLGEHKMPPDY